MAESLQTLSAQERDQNDWVREGAVAGLGQELRGELELRHGAGARGR